MPFDANQTNETLTQRLLDRLLALRPQELITHDEIEQLTEGRGWIIGKAMSRASQSAGANFESQRGLGYRRMSDGEAPVVGDKAIKRNRKNSDRAIKRMLHTVARSNSMSNDEIIKTHSRISVLEFTKLLNTARSANQKEAEHRVSHRSSSEAARASLEAMRGALGSRKR